MPSHTRTDATGGNGNVLIDPECAHLSRHSPFKIACIQTNFIFLLENDMSNEKSQRCVCTHATGGIIYKQRRYVLLKKSWDTLYNNAKIFKGVRARFTRQFHRSILFDAKCTMVTMYPVNINNNNFGLILSGSLINFTWKNASFHMLQFFSEYVPVLSLGTVWKKALISDDQKIKKTASTLKTPSSDLVLDCNQLVKMNITSANFNETRGAFIHQYKDDFDVTFMPIHSFSEHPVYSINSH
ncbi:hypothetical protein ABEB36_006919 [Hypothenemus hampei]|uniref:Uncharacterized protein n=1 Tax=Hypothenemus hampei TaxID=57062 RepID=A0ABD1ES54_HYPHA